MGDQNVIRDQSPRDKGTLVGKESPVTNYNQSMGRKEYEPSRPSLFGAITSQLQCSLPPYIKPFHCRCSTNEGKLWSERITQQTIWAIDGMTYKQTIIPLKREAPLRIKSRTVLTIPHSKRSSRSGTEETRTLLIVRSFILIFTLSILPFQEQPLSLQPLLAIGSPAVKLSRPLLAIEMEITFSSFSIFLIIQSTSEIDIKLS